MSGSPLEVKRLSWKKAAPGVLGPGLRRAIEKLRSIPGGGEKVQAILAKLDKGPFAVRLAAREAGGILDKVRYRADLAQAALGQEFHAGVSVARSELRAVQRDASEAHEALAAVPHQSRDARAALGEIETIENASVEAERELGVAEARSGVLEEINQGESVLPEAPGAEGEAPAGAEAAAAEEAGVLTEQDLQKLGSGLNASKTPPQTLWREDLVNTVAGEALKQGSLTTEQANKNGDISRSVLNEALPPADGRVYLGVSTGPQPRHREAPRGEARPGLPAGGGGPERRPGAEAAQDRRLQPQARDRTERLVPECLPRDGDQVQAALPEVLCPCVATVRRHYTNA